ncbi:MAG: hypothetical protein F9K45_01165 [Melioribacteraceae bacterium]|nr:MAG: hypothetical protein F9K45_01165 [Melioribacteraceae bacterium]
MKRLTIILITVVLAFNFSCKDSGTGPEEKKSVRDYTWTTDTLTNGASQTLMSSIWASSSKDIYICGHNSRNSGFLWHYNGNKWIDVDIFGSIQLGPVKLNSVHGISSDNVWAVGSRVSTNPTPPPNFVYQSFIIRFDGVKWKEENVKTKSAVYSVYANAENDVWACGEDGIVYHFNGNRWDIDTVAPPFEGSQFKLNNISVYKDKPYAMGNTQDLVKFQDVYYFFSLVNNEWVLLDSMRTDASNINFKWGVGRLYSAPWGKLYSSGWGIFEFTGNTWNKIIPFFDINNPVRWMDGTNEKNIILAGDFGKSYHWNGTDLYKLTALEDEGILYTGVWMDENETFIIGYTTTGFPDKTIVWHGK